MKERRMVEKQKKYDRKENEKKNRMTRMGGKKNGRDKRIKIVRQRKKGKMERRME